MIPKAAGLIFNDSEAVADFDPLSVTFTVKLLDPAVPGVPEMDPPADRLNPAGNDPLASDHVYGAVPPVALSDCAYTVPTLPSGRDVVAIVGGLGLAVMENAFVSLPPALSVNLTVKLAVPAAEGVPPIAPVDPSRVNP